MKNYELINGKTKNYQNSGRNNNQKKKNNKGQIWKCQKLILQKIMMTKLGVQKTLLYPTPLQKLHVKDITKLEKSKGK